ncbi:Leucine-rich repeat-containing protein 15 [Branchiostoma belcheri]|nr:Leucine-rich repeat-containing protein 15 [Branchiostoma belcheri]
MQTSRVTCRAAAVCVLALLWVLTAVFTCPEKCDCNSHGRVICAKRELKDVPYNILPNTTVLDLGYNSIQNLSEADFSNLTSLVFLRLKNNSIGVLPAGIFSHHTRLLEVLDLAGNRIANLPDGVFSNLTSLIQLLLNGNRIASLPAGIFSQLTRLERLELSDNHIADLPDGVFSSLASLLELNLINNSISSLPSEIFSHLTRLEWLELSDNHIADLPGGVFSNLTSLRLLHLTNNRISSLPGGIFSQLTRLEWLNLLGNHIADLDLPVFSNLASLERLILSDNNISSLQPGIFSHLTRLTLLDLSGNNITDAPERVFSSLTSLIWLFLSDNNISSLPVGIFSQLRNLGQLYLSENPLRCDCSLQNLMTSQRVRESIRDDPVCSSPPHMEGDELIGVVLMEMKICNRRGDCTTANADGSCACHVGWTGTYCDKEFNLALGKNATQSSTQRVSQGAERAVDGNNLDCAETNIENQPWWKVDLAGLYSVSRVSILSASRDVRLQGGSHAHEGRVEVFHDGQWGTICHHDWTIVDAHVVCRQLGYPGADEAKTNAFFGDGTGPIWLDYVGCTGSEMSITECDHGRWGVHSCAHHLDAGVVCTMKGGLTNIIVRVGSNENFTRNDQCGQTFAATPGQTREVYCNPAMSGRYVSVQRMGHALALCEDIPLNTKERKVGLCCDDAMGLLNGQITPTNGGYCSGNDIQFSCDPGYELVGNSSATCQEDGSWDGDLPTCQHFFNMDSASRGVGWCSGRSFDCELGDPGSNPSRTRDMSGHAPNVVSLGKALYTTFLTPPRCEWVPNFGAMKTNRNFVIAHTEPEGEIRTSTEAIIAGTIAGIAAVMIVAAVVFMVFLRRRRKIKKDNITIQRRRMEEAIPLVPARPQFPRFETDPDRLTLGEKIGSGAFGLVYRATLTRNGKTQEVVVKTVKESASEDDKLSFLEEIRAVVDLGVHENLLGLVGCCTVVRDHLYLITEFMPYGDLKSFLRKCQEFETSDEPRDDIYTFEVIQMYQVSRQIAKGMGELHRLWRDHVGIRPRYAGRGASASRSLTSDINNTPPCVLSSNSNKCSSSALCSDTVSQVCVARGPDVRNDHIAQSRYVHGDLAARNVLVGKRLHVKISDFGLAEDINSRGYRRQDRLQRVPWKWMAPERLESGEAYTTQSDVWSFGIVLYELCTLGGNPYPGVEVSELKERLEAGFRMAQPEDCPRAMYDLMLQCWRWHPAQRPSFDTLYLTLDKNLELYGPEYATTT